MNLNQHSDLKGTHALFSPSQPSWLRYNGDKVVDKYMSQYRAPIGTEIHDYAAAQIILGQKPSGIRNLKNDIASFIFAKYKDNPKISDSFVKTIIFMMKQLPNEVFNNVKTYIEDAIGFRMIPEQIVYHSDYIFGTADALCFRNNTLRIHDLKTGALPAHMEQLLVYSALYCLEYDVNPASIDFELRLYQTSGIEVFNPTTEDISPIIDQIISISKIINKLNEEELS